MEAVIGDEREWARWRQMGADPVVVDRSGGVWSTADWDFDRHAPRPGAKPRNRP